MMCHITFLCLEFSDCLLYKIIVKKCFIALIPLRVYIFGHISAFVMTVSYEIQKIYCELTMLAIIGFYYLYRKDMFLLDMICDKR